MEGNAFTHVQSANAFGTINLMCGKREEINVKLMYIKRQLTSGLHGVDVQQYAMLLSDSTQLGDALDRPDLVIRQTDTYQHGIRRELRLEVRDIDCTFLINRKCSYCNAFGC